MNPWVEWQSKETHSDKGEKRKIILKSKDTLRDLWDINQNITCFKGDAEGEERQIESEKWFEELMSENFPNLGEKLNMQVQKFQKVPKNMNPNLSTPRHTIIKIANVKYKEKY